MTETEDPSETAEDTATPLGDVGAYTRQRRPLRRYLVPFVLATILSLLLFFGLAWIAATVINATR